MDQWLGRGLLGSLRSEVAHAMQNLSRENAVVRAARFSTLRRLTNRALAGRSVWHFLLFYLFVLSLALVCEWAGNRFFPCLLPGYYGVASRDFVKDVGSYLITAQIGILAIVSVAVGVVTLLSERNDGSTVNTDIRLYYFESVSYELAISAVALVVVLSLQLFWPLQHLMHSLGLGGRDYSFKLALVAFHTLWFTFNLFLFLQFIMTTLRFVEPSTRERMRERYSANVIIPRDAANRLIRAIFRTAPQRIFGSSSLSQGPLVTFGHGLELQPVFVEVETSFRHPMTLVDVWLRPMRWVLGLWHRRAQKQPSSAHGYGGVAWRGQLAVVVDMGQRVEGPVRLITRSESVPLLGWEKWILKRCLRFKRAALREQDLPTPSDFLEQLVDKVARQIEESATTGFRGALAAAVRYHQFILAAQNTRDPGGDTLNLAEVGDIFLRPDIDWVHQYRRLFNAAADRIGNDTEFIDRLSNLAARLVPPNAATYPASILEHLLNLGLYEVIALEDWITRRAVIGEVSEEPGSSAALTGSDKRAYNNVLIGFVGGWESLLQTLIYSFKIERSLTIGREQPSEQAQVETWYAFVRAFPVVQAHLRHAAYFFAAAVWNNDAQGADWFRDLLLRWLQPFYFNLQSSYNFRNTFLFTPELVKLSWPEARAYAGSHVLLHPEQRVQPGPLSGAILWELHSDVICVSALVALYWYVTSQQPSASALQAAKSTLERRVGTDGTTLTQMSPKTTFRLLFDFAIRYALHPRFDDNRYSGTIEEIIRSLTNLASPRMVSGRIYGGFVIGGVESLRPVLFGALVAHFPQTGDDGVTAALEGMLADAHFEKDDAVRTFLESVEHWRRYLDDIQQNEVFQQTIATLNPLINVEDVMARLRETFTRFITQFQALRQKRLREAPLDESRLEAVRQRVTSAVLAGEGVIGCFHDVHIRRILNAEIAKKDFEFGDFDKGSFVIPEMSPLTFDELPPFIAEGVAVYLNNDTWQQFYQRPKRVVLLNVSGGRQVFWRSVLEESVNVGPSPLVIVPYENYGEDVNAVLWELGAEILEPYNVTRVDAMPSGGNANYLGTIEGVHVYSSGMMIDRAVLCSGHLIHAIEYGVVHGDHDICDFSIIDGEDLTKVRIRLTFAQRILWADWKFVEFRISGDTPEEEDGE
jgi:hypothetical protein